MATAEVQIIRATTNNTSLVRASNVVTVTMSAATTNVKVGDRVRIAGVTPESFNSAAKTHYIVTEVVSSTVYKYAQSGIDESSTVHGTTGGDYALLSTWEAQNRNLVTEDVQLDCQCYNDWPTGLNDTIRIETWTTSATCFMRVYAPAGHRHNGVSRSGFWMRSTSSGAVFRIFTQSLYINVFDIEAVNQNEATSTTSNAFQFAAASIEGAFYNLIGQASKIQPVAAFVGSGRVGKWFVNCLAINTYYGFSSGRDVRYDNCTAIDCVTGFYTTDTNMTYAYTHVAVNCVAFGCTTSFRDDGSASYYQGVSDHNSADRGIMYGANSMNTLTAAAFVDYAGSNYRPAVGGALAGTGSTGTGYTIDIQNLTRVVPWDRGAYKADSTPAPSGGIYVGSNKVEELRLGGTLIQSVYLGSNKIH